MTTSLLPPRCATPPQTRLPSRSPALLSADHAISETFNGNAPNRLDAQLARSLAVTLAEALDDLFHGQDTTHDTAPIRLSDVLL